MSQTTTPSGADVLAVMEKCAVILDHVGCDCHAACEDEAEDLRQARTAVAALIARNAELTKVAAEHRDGRLASLEKVAELEAAIHRLLPHAQHADSCGDMDAYNNSAVESCGCGLDSAIEFANEAIDAGGKMVTERDALAAENKVLRADAERWQEVSRRFDGSKTSAACLTLEGLGLEPTPYRSFAENVDAALARTPANGDAS